MYLDRFDCVNAASLSVRAEPPDASKKIHQDTSWNILLSGEIDADAPARVADALAMAGPDGADVFMHSPGGNLFAGLMIGRLIREAGADTYIGGLARDKQYKADVTAGMKSVPGICYSACAFAFLGGVYRSTIADSKYGVHRFPLDPGRPTDKLNDPQALSGAIDFYLREMSVDPALFDLTINHHGKEDIRVLTFKEMVDLNVVNGWKKPEWSIEAGIGGQYLRGRQESGTGGGQAVFTCVDHQIVYQSRYRPGAATARSVAAGDWNHALLLDGRRMALPAPLSPTVSGDDIVTFFPITVAQALSIASSSSIGHEMINVRVASAVVGYRVDVPRSASQKVRRYINRCLR